MIKSSNLAWISVSDFNKARKFFKETLGLKETNCAEEYGWAELSCPEGGAMIGLAQENPEMKAGQNAVITLTVDDLEKTVAELKKKGVKMLGEIMEVPGHVKLQLFTDLDGNKLQLVQLLSE